MKVSIIGGTGFVGSYIIDALLKSGHMPRVLVRPGSAPKLLQAERCEIIPGDIADIGALENCLQGTDTVIYLIGILREFPGKGVTFEETQFRGVERTVTSAQKQGVKQFILMSANGVKAGGTPYQDSKFRAEQCIQASGLDWTIFRPSVIFGNPRGKMEFCTQLNKELIQPPIPAPLFFSGLNVMQSGKFQMSPVHVQDVASAFTTAVGNPTANQCIFPLCGPDAPSWQNILQTIAQAAGNKGKLMLPAPADAIKLVASILDKQPWFPITRDQITMLLEGNTCPDQSVWESLGIHPQRFSAENLAYLNKG